MKRVVWIVAAMAAGFSQAEVVLRVVPGQESGLKQVVEDWAAAELTAQGGKYGDHGWWPWGLTAVDLDNDGDADLVPSHHGSPGGLVLLNLFRETGRLTFTNATAEFGVASRDLPTGMGLRTLGMDMNGDGWIDLVGIRSPHYLNEGGRKLIPKGKKGFDTFHPVGVEDVNGDGYPDIREALEVLILNPEKVEFTRQAAVPSAESSVPADILNAVHARRKAVRFWRYGYELDHDLNGDGIADVIVSGVAGYNLSPLAFYMAGDKNGGLTDQTTPMGLPTNAACVCVADLTGDGAPEVLTAESDAAGLFVNDGQGHFTRKAGPVTDFLKATGPYCHRVWTVDFDCDGDFDLVLSNPRYGRAIVCENTGAGEFQVRHKAEGWDSDPVAVCDLNGDGLPDLAIGGPKNTITLYVNESKAGSFCNISPRMDKPNWTAAGAWVEVFREGQLGVPGAKPFRRERAHADGTPVHVGLGQAASFDLRVTFPAPRKTIVEKKAVAAGKRWKITPDGACVASD